MHGSVVLFVPLSAGWAPIVHMGELAARLFDVPFERPVSRPPSILRKIRLRMPLPRAEEEGWVLYLASSPATLATITALPDFHRVSRRAVWIIDSFRTEHTPHSGLFRHFDLVAFAQKGEAAHYERLAPGRTLYLGWGADVLDRGSRAAERDIDVLRVGRQPQAWDDDAHSAEVCARAGLSFHGRPPFVEAGMSVQHAQLMQIYARSKFIVAFSNRVAPAPYTHPTKDYVTGRWTDALASGATVAGIPPSTDRSVEDLLWRGATLEFGSIDLAANVRRLEKAVADWTPEVARRNHREALGRLDWRWRFKQLAERLEIQAPRLDEDIRRLQGVLSDTVG